MADLRPDDLEWLCGPEAAAVMDDLAGSAVTATLIARLRKTLTAPRAAAVAEQVELRQRAKEKFHRAERMLFTRRAFEQATDEWVARYKGRRFEKLHGEGEPLDFCCGVGGDLIGLAGAVRSVFGIERDATLARFAQHNAAAYDLEVEVRCGEADENSARGARAWHADPDRRPAGRRTTAPDAHEPPLSVVEAWLRDAPAGAVKFAPAARLPQAWEEASELEWISRDGSCRQLVAWRGDLAAGPGQRTATRVLSGPMADDRLIQAASFTAAPASQPAPAPIDAYVYDPDPALLAAGLTWSLAAEHGLVPFTARAAYLTGSQRIDDPLLAPFRVEEVLALDRRKLRDWLGERGIGRLEIKTRGVNLSPERLRAELKSSGAGAMTLVVAPAPIDWPGAADRPCVIVCQRLTH